jgi:hypothetical protein
MTVTGIRRKEGTAPTAGRIEQHFAASFEHQTGTDEELCQGYGSDRASVRYLAEKFSGIATTKTKENAVVRLAEFSGVIKRVHGMISSL